MPFAKDSYTGNGSTKEFNISFAYILESHIEVALNEVATTAFTVDTSTNPKKVVMDTLASATATQEATGAPKTGVNVVVQRRSSLNAALVDYTDGSTLIADDLDTSNKQFLFLLQERDDEAQDNMQATLTGQDAQNKKIINVNDPTNAQDAATKNYVDTTTQPVDAELTELATMSSGTASALADLTGTEVQILDGATVSTNELNTLDGITATTSELNTLDGITASTAELNTLDGVTASTAELNKLDGATLSTAELNTLDGITASTAELNKLDGATLNTAELNTLDGITATTAELNQLDGNSLTGIFNPTATNQFPSAAATSNYVLTLVNALGGFVAIANENSFPNANPDPSDGAGTVVSIADAGGLVVNGSGVATGQTLGLSTVTINGFPSSLHSTTLGAGLGLQVQTTTTQNTYTYHKLIAKETDVKQLSDDINDFLARYRVATSDPTIDLDEGDLVFNKTSNRLKVYDGSAWQLAAAANASEVTSSTVGNITTTNVQAALQELDAKKVHITLTNGSAELPVGTTAQRDASPSAGLIRYNSTINQFEGYGTAWGSIGAGATGGGSDTWALEHDNTITTSYAIGSGKNVISAGPITVNTNATITVPSGSTWTIV